MPESNPLCRPEAPGIAHGRLPDLISPARTWGGAHRVWTGDRDRKTFLRQTFERRESRMAAASSFQGEPVVLGAAPPAAAPPPPEPPSRDLGLLTDEFRLKVEALLVRCAARGTPMRPYYAIRSPFQQARLWRQSRSKDEIDARVAELRDQSAPFLADCILRVGPQQGNPVTNAVPGLSWHQWGEAVDCFWLVGGAAEWSAKKKIDGVNGYQIYAQEAQSAGLTAGGLWTSIKDWPHVQLRADSSPLKVMSLAEIDQRMKERFGP